MSNKTTKDFLTGVNEILTAPHEQELLFQSLRQYRNDDDLDALVSALQALVFAPDRLPLYEAVRPLIPASHQLQYDRKTHLLAARMRVRVVRLSLRQGPLGFAFRGGLEHGCGCFVSAVTAKSAAANAGLRPGDEILRVNGFPVARATHEEVAALMRARPELKMKVKRVGMVPKQEKPGEPMTWEFSSPGGSVTDVDSVVDAEPFQDNSGGDGGGGGGGEELRLFLNARGAPLGCIIFSGPAHHPGIFVQSVTPGGLAEQAGLREGDQLVEVNGMAFGADITHSHAVMVLKAPTGIHMTIRRREGPNVFTKKQPVSAQSPWTAQRPQQLSTFASASTEEHRHFSRPRSESPTSKSPSSGGTVTPTRAESRNDNVFFGTRTTSPEKVTSPTRNTTSPEKVTPPTRNTTSPEKVTSPTRNTSSPEKVTSPTRNTTSPEKVTSPTRNTTSPEKKTSPTRNTTSPEKKTSPTRNTTSPEKVTPPTRNTFSSRETAGRFVESVRLVAKGSQESEGCGVHLEEVPGGQIAVASVEYGSPAFRADVRLGDYLLAIANEKIAGLGLARVQQRLQNAEAKPEFVLTLARAPAGIFTDEVTYF